MTLRSIRLNAFLEDQSKRGTVWGVNDCCNFVGDWVELETGMSLERPQFNSEKEARRIIQNENGMQQIWRSLARNANLIECPSYEIGDICIVKMSVGPVGAIWAGSGIIALRSQSGVFFIGPRKDTIIASWMLPNCEQNL